jgi:phosphonate transport system ATP-binding protein
MQKPILLLADEPVASLDPATANSVLQYFEKINKELGTTIICSLHFLSLVRKYASRVIALRDGEIVFKGDATDINDVLFREIYGDDSSDFEIK